MNGNDGSIRIGTKIDTSGAEKDLEKLQQECEKTAQAIGEAGKKVKTTFTGMSAKELERSLAKANKELEKTLEMQRQLEAQGQAISDSYAPMYAQATTEEQRQNIDAMQEQELAPINEQWAAVNAKADEYRQIIADITARLAQMASGTEENTAATEEGTKEIKKQQTETKRLGKEAQKTGQKIKHSMEHGLKSAIRMTLAIFGVRGAFMAVRKAANAYMEDNEYLTNQISGIWQVLGEAIGPVVEKVIHWITVAVSYINAFIKALTGVDLIAKANAKSLAKQAKATKDAAKAAQTAGFDEITKLQDTSSSSDFGGGNAGFQPVDVDTDAVDKFTEKLKEIQGIVAGIALGLLAWKVLDTFGASLGVCAGMFLTIAGVCTTINGFIDAWKNGLDWDNLLQMITGITAAVIGLGVAFGTIGAAIGLIVGGLALVVSGFKSWIDDGRSAEALTAISAGILAIGAGISLLTGSWIPLAIAAVAAFVVACLMYGDEIKDWLWGAGNDVGNFFNKIGDKIESFFKDIGKKLEDFGGIGAAVSAILIAVGDTVAIVFRLIGDVVKILIDIVAAVVKTIQAIGSGDWKGAWEAWKKVFKDVWDAIVRVVQGCVNLIIDIVNVMIRAMNKISFDVPDWVPGIGGKHVGFNINEIRHVNWLARGGIVNNPGRGVPVIAGEAGAEAVLPLDRNTEWMDMLAERINGTGGKNIVVQVILSGKKIHEEMIKLDQRRNFATNGAI